MSWSYDPSQLSTSTLYQVRLEVGDTNESAQLLQDEEISQFLAVEQNTWGAAARCCEVISRTMLRKADVRVGRGGTDLVYSTAAKQYAAMAATLRKRANATNAPWTGGTSISEKLSQQQDSDLVQPLFTKSGGNNPYVGGQDLTPTDDEQEAFQ